MSPAQIARVLKPFGVSTRTLRLGEDDRAKGHLRDDFKEAFSRYLPGFPLSQRDNVTTRSQSGDDLLFQSVTPSSCQASENRTNPAPDVECHAVTDQNPVSPDDEEVFEGADAMEVFADEA